MTSRKIVMAAKGIAAAFALFMVSPMSLAGTVAYENFSFVFGEGEDKTVAETFTVEESGTYKATITDLKISAPFEQLAFVVLDGMSDLGNVTDAAGGSSSFTFEGVAGTDYTAIIGGQNGGNLGLWEASVALVPIPAAGLLFASSLAGLVVVMRRKVAPSAA